MSHRPSEKDFKLEEYDTFYEHHSFMPIRDEDYLDAHRVIPRVGWALDIATELKPSSVLDLGCLDGSLLLTLVNHLKTGTTGVGVDLSEEGTDLGRKRADINGLPVEFYKSDIESWMEKTDKTFDLITCFEVMEHVKDPELVFKLIDKCLAPGGTVLISTPDFEAPTYGKDDEQNKCHIRLYTLADEDYEAVNKFGNTRTATSLPKQLKGYNIVSQEVFSELIHLRYTR